MSGVEGGTGAGGVEAIVEWRVTGIRRWLPVLLMVSSSANAASSILRLTDPDPSSLPRSGDVVFLVLAGLVFVCALFLLAVTVRTRVTLGPEAVVITAGRRRVVPYDDVQRAYRDRWSSGAITLALRDGSRLVLPAPTAGPKTQNADLDRALDLLRERLVPAGGRSGEPQA